MLANNNAKDRSGIVKTIRYKQGDLQIIIFILFILMLGCLFDYGRVTKVRAGPRFHGKRKVGFSISSRISDMLLVTYPGATPRRDTSVLDPGALPRRR